jgi:hypothetical protein
MRLNEVAKMIGKSRAYVYKLHNRLKKEEPEYEDEIIHDRIETITKKGYDLIIKRVENPLRKGRKKNASLFQETWDGVQGEDNPG